MTDELTTLMRQKELKQVEFGAGRIVVPVAERRMKLRAAQAENRSRLAYPKQ